MDQFRPSWTARHSSTSSSSSLIDVPFFNEISSISIDPNDASIRPEYKFIPSRIQLEDRTVAISTIPPLLETKTHYFAKSSLSNGDKMNTDLNTKQRIISKSDMYACDVRKSPRDADTENGEKFVRPYEYDEYDSLYVNTAKLNHRIHINPSVLLSQDRANYPDLGTPIPNLSKNYFYSNQLPKDFQSFVSGNGVSRKKRKRVRMKTTKKSKNDNNASNTVVNTPEDFAKVVLNVGTKYEYENKHTEELLRDKTEKELIDDECKMKKIDARLWLNAKANLIAQSKSNTTTTSSCSSTATNQFQDYVPKLKSQKFIDRATSPINFPHDKQIIKSKTREIALSPIRFVTPRLRHFRSHSDERTTTGSSSSLSQTIEVNK